MIDDDQIQNDIDKTRISIYNTSDLRKLTKNFHE